MFRDTGIREVGPYMSQQVLMPKLGLTMTEGNVAEWRKNVGDSVRKGEVLLVVATDKLTFDVEAQEDGVLLQILVPAGQSVPVSAPIAVIGARGEAIDGLRENGPQAEPSRAPAESALKGVAGAEKRVSIIGGGPGGYVAAIRAAQLGAKVTLVEKGPIGGTCLNVGCIPTKVLLHTAEVFSEIGHAKDLGISVTGASVDWNALMMRKNAAVQTLTGGVTTLLRSNGVRVLAGEASFVSSGEIVVRSANGGEEKVEHDAAIIATGSEAFVPPVPGFDLPGVITSTEALSLSRIPKSMTLVGGGVIGVEFASIFASFGTSLTIVEMLPEILPNIDEEITGILKATLLQRGVRIHTSSKVTGVRRSDTGLVVAVETPDGRMDIEAECVLVCVGRKPNTSALALDRAGVSVDRGRIVTDQHMRTSQAGIYAVGDCTSPIMLAHVASREGVVAAENIMGHDVVMDYRTTPSAIYTSPEVASVGLTERQAGEKGIAVRVGRFPLAANGKSMIVNDVAGIVKYIVDEKYGEILGLHIIGPRATDLIVEGALAIRLEATVDEIVTTIHAHPTIGEALAEAALASRSEAIHLPKKQ